MVINHVSGPIFVPRVPRIKALGTVYNFDGDGDRGVEAQLDKARKAFYAEQHVFCNKLISLQKRYRHYVSRVVPVILHGCHVWTWTQSLKQKLDNFENGLLRRMFSVKRKKMANGTLEHFVTWRQRHTRIVRKSFLAKHVVLSLCERCAKRLFSFAWRLSNEKPNHLRSLILASARWRNKASWVSLQAVGQANSEGWRHAVAGQRKRRWEDVLCSIIGEDWIDSFSTFASCEFKDRCEKFILECFDFVSCACVGGRKKKKASQSPEAPPKAERPLTECPDPGQWSWDEMPTNGTRV